MGRVDACRWMSRVLFSAMLMAGLAHADSAHARKDSSGNVVRMVAGKVRKAPAGTVAKTAPRKAAAASKATPKTASKSVPGRKVAGLGTAVAGKTTKIRNKSKGSAAKSSVSVKTARAPVSSLSDVTRTARPATAVARKAVTTAQAPAPGQARSGRALPMTSVEMQRAWRPDSADMAPVTAQKVSVAVGNELSSAADLSPAVAGRSLGDAIGLSRIPDPLALRSSVALVVDPRTGKILYDKNSSAVLPIASVTKLMTAMVVLDAGQPLDERIRIEASDRDTERFSSSHLPVGSELTRAELLQLALMSSENRAASALARTYPGGLQAFIDAANRKARNIGMWDSVFLDATGLSASNVSSARDLAVLVARASRYPEIQRFSVAPQLQVRTAYGTRVFHTTNPLVGNQQWGLTLQKTGFINEAGNCMVMQARVDGRQLIVVLLDSQGRYSRVSDANRLRRFIEG